MSSWSSSTTRRARATWSSVSEHLLEALAPAYDVLSREVHSMASVGIVIGDPVSCNSSAEEIVRNADVAMYDAKRSAARLLRRFQ